MGFADLNRTGYSALDKIEGDPKTVSNACISRFRARILIIEDSGPTRILQLWDLEDPDFIPAELMEPTAASDQVAAGAPDAGDSKSRRPSIDTNAQPTEKSPPPSTDAKDEKSARPSIETSGHNITDIPLLESLEGTTVDPLSPGDSPVVTFSATDEPEASSGPQPSDEAVAAIPPANKPREPYPLRLLAWMTLPQTNDDTRFEPDPFCGRYSSCASGHIDVFSGR